MASNKVLLSLQHHMIHKWNLKPVAMQFLNLNLNLSEWTKANMQHNKRSCHNHHLIYLNSCKKTHTIKFCRFRKRSWALAISAWHHLKPSCKQSQWKHQTFGLRTHTHTHQLKSLTNRNQILCYQSQLNLSSLRSSKEGTNTWHCHPW